MCTSSVNVTKKQGMQFGFVCNIFQLLTEKNGLDLILHAFEYLFDNREAEGAILNQQDIFVIVLTSVFLFKVEFLKTILVFYALQKGVHIKTILQIKKNTDAFLECKNPEKSRIIFEWDHHITHYQKLYAKFAIFTYQLTKLPSSFILSLEKYL